jgi:hypothetical protein
MPYEKLTDLPDSEREGQPAQARPGDLPGGV